MKRSRMKKKPARRGPMPPDVAYSVQVRDQHQCQAHAHGFDLPTKCDGPMHLHHKHLRSQGGPDTVDNITTICQTHHTRAHDVIRAEAEATDIIRRSTHRTRTTP